jgi:hypothetical protein
MPATNVLQEVWSWGFGILTCISSTDSPNFTEIWGVQFWKLLFCCMLIWHCVTLKASFIVYAHGVELSPCHKLWKTRKDMYTNVPYYIILSESSMNHLLDHSSLTLSLIMSYIYIYIYIVCPRRNGQNFGRVFLMLKYTDITQNTYIHMELLVKPEI